jgi:flagellar hook assembly protein FlgD
MPSRGHASLRIYNVQGRLVQTVVDGIANAGLHRVLWTGEDQHGDPVASGVYFYGLETPGGILSRRMVLLR